MAEANQQSDNSGGVKEPDAKRRKKSTGFPVVSLAEAAEVVKEAGKYGFDHSATAFAAYMGHSSTNSGAFRQRLAAFRDWNLIAGRGDNLSMTEVARRIALPPDREAEVQALREAFMNSPVFSRLYADSAKGTPLAQESLGRSAVHNYGIAPGSKDRFVASFVESALVAGLADLTEDGHVLLTPPGGHDDDALEGADDEVDHATSMIQRSPAHSRSSQRPDAPVVHQTWDIGGGSILLEIRTQNPLPAKAFVAVGEVVASLEVLAETLRADVTTDDDGLEAPE
jgi:hypothetical protein